jgi:cytochrome d ubiquinol oxidase subunit I
MHTPSGFEVLPGGEWRVLDPWAAFKSASFPTQASHMATAAYSSVAFAVLGIHAYGRLSRPDSAFHRRAIQIVLPVAVIAAPLQVWTGDASAKHLAVHQPSKLAAAEGLFQTQTRAPLSIVGWPDRETKTLRFALEIPGALSMLGKGSFDAEIRGLDRVPEDEWPNLPLVYLAFHGMVGAGFAMLGLAGWGALVWARRREPSRLFLRAAILAAPLGLFAVEAGWFVTEVGRYPWIIRGVLKVPQAVTPMPSLWIPFAAFTVLYLFLGLSVVVMLRRHVFRAEEERA